MPQQSKSRETQAMTAQMNDLFHYRGRQYAVAGISRGVLFEPSVFGLEPIGRWSNCRRGYQAVFALAGSRLVLDELHVNLTKPEKPVERMERLEGPIIHGVKPGEPRGKGDHFDNHYEGLNYPLKYTGGLLLADGFIFALYVHMGFHPAWKYERVVELIFEAGTLVQEVDRSEEMAEFRRGVLERAENEPDRTPGLLESIRFVKRSFDRTYRTRRS